MAHSAEELSYIVCDTYEAASQAASELSEHSTLILDCEGRDLGMPGGALSVIAIGDETASKVFLFDTLALSDKAHALLAPFLSILGRRDITKLTWDGRADFYEIAEAYGVQMEGVLDLQLAEVVQRGRRKRKGSWRETHTIDYFRGMKDELEADPAALEGIHRVYGLDRCAGLYKLIGKGEGKNRECLILVTSMQRFEVDIGPADDVVALHCTDAWMKRPLPPTLLEYSAHDIQLIAKVYARFQKKGTYLNDPEAMMAMTERYMKTYPTRELRAKHALLDLCKFVPLEVLTAPQEGVPKFECARCERVLSLSSFATAEGTHADEVGEIAPPPADPQAETAHTIAQRLTLCRLCHIVARRGKEEALGEWVTLLD